MSFDLYERDAPEVEEDKDSTTITTLWGFQGTNSYSELRTYVLQITPATLDYNGRTLGRKGWRPRFQPGEWGYVDVIYSSAVSEQQALQSEGPPGEPLPPPPPFPTPTDSDKLDSNWTLSTRGGTVHVNVSKELIATAGSGTPPSTGNVIGSSIKGIRGTDVPAMKLSCSITIPTDLKLPTIRTLARIDEPKTNSAPWLGMDRGEWLYVGADAQGSGNGQGSLTIHLEGGENLVAGDPRLIINSTITLPAKKAHEYVDFIYQAIEADGYGFQEARFAYIHRMFDEMDFGAAFGFG
jgi:hypothetical protein